MGFTISATYWSNGYTLQVKGSDDCMVALAGHDDNNNNNNNNNKRDNVYGAVIMAEPL